MTRTWRGFAPGKLILCGEHAVVYGHPAVALAVDRGTTVELCERSGPSSVEAGRVRDDRLDRALRTLLPPEGIGVAIESELPVGRGMGSSAALAVALVRALAAREGREADFDECDRLGFEVERVFHGNPSGIDHAVSARGGALRYQRGPEGPMLEPVQLPDLRLVVLDSGAAGDTRSLVARVAAQRPGIDPVLERIGQLVDQVLTAPRADLGPLLTENHRLLAEIGVSTPALDELVELALGAGAQGAKLAGAGGGGVVIALADDPEPVLAAARSAGVSAFTVGIHPGMAR